MLKSSVFGNEPQFAGCGLDDGKRIWGETEIAVEVAGDRRSWIAVALHTDFRSQVHFVEFCGNPFSEFFNGIDPKRPFGIVQKSVFLATKCERGRGRDARGSI